MDARRTGEADLIAQDAAVLSACEVGLGGILHGLKLPLSGYFLSLNQIFLLSRSVLKTKSQTAAFSISSIAAVLKSLSPAGKKLTPMLAISAQGLLFSLGTFIFGANLTGVLVGGVLASVWGFLQPFLIYYFIFGSKLIDALRYFWEKLEGMAYFSFFHGTSLAGFVLALISLKALLAAAAALLAYLLPESAFQKWQAKVLTAARRSPKNPAREPMENEKREGAWENAFASLRSLLNPLFLFSLAVTVLFFLLAETPRSALYWVALRPLALGFLLFFSFRYVPYGWLRRRQPLLAASMEKMRDLFR